MSNILDKFSMQGRTAIVTGGAGLLGRQFTLALAQAGAKVVVADLNTAAAQAHAQTLSDQGYLAIGVGVNITAPDSAKAMVQAALDFGGRLDVLVNSAAMDPKFDPQNQSTQNANAFESYPLKSWQDALDVNLTGMFLACQAAAEPMVAQNYGVFINICSTYGLVGPDQRIYERPGQTSRQFKPVYYSVTKAGVLGLTHYLATYYAGTKIRANALTPGGVFNNHDEVFLKAYTARTVMGRMAEQDEMSGALLFLASEASSYMTGGNVVVDGGWTAW